LVPFDGFVRVDRIEPDPVQLRRWAPDRERATEMLRTLRAAAEILA
jgi:hypothetical protein